MRAKYIFTHAKLFQTWDRLFEMEVAKMQILRGAVPRPPLQLNQPFGALQHVTLGRSVCLDSIGSDTFDASRLGHQQLGCWRPSGPAKNQSSSRARLHVTQAAERPDLSANLHELPSYSDVKASGRSSHISGALSSAIEAHALAQVLVDPSERQNDYSEPDLLNEEPDGPFHLPLANLRSLLGWWDIDSIERTDHPQLLAVADYLERLGLDVYFREEIKAILDGVFRIWTEGGLRKAASTLGDLESVGLAFYLLRSHEYDVQPSIFQLYRKEDGSFCKRPQLQAGGGEDAQDADVDDLLNLLRASDVRFRCDVVMQDAYEFASTALSSLVDGCLSDKTSAEIRYRLKYPWAINFRMLETRQTIINFQPEIVRAKFPSGKLSSQVVSYMLSTASQLVNHYIAVFQREIEILERWTEESGMGKVNVRLAMVFLPFQLGLAYEMPQAKYAHTRDVWGKLWYLVILVDDLYDGALGATMEDILVFMDAYKKFDPSILEKLPQEERLAPLRMIYKALYDLTKSAAKQSSIWHGRDLLQTFINIWMVRLEIYLNELRWKESHHKFTVDQYMDEYAKWSFACETVGPLGYYSIPGWKPSNYFLEIRPDMDAIFALAKTGRFLNDARSYQYEKDVEGKAGLINFLMDKNPHLDEEAAFQLSCQYAQEAVKEFKEEIFSSKIPHRLVKQILLAAFRTSALVYYFDDGLRMGDCQVGKLMEPVPNLTNTN